MNNLEIIQLFTTIWFISILCSILLWVLFIRPYIRKNDRSPGSGANYGWAAITDASIADEIARKKGKKPWFLRMFWILVLLEFGIAIAGFAIYGFNQ